jgi:glycine reductase
VSLQLEKYLARGVRLGERTGFTQGDLEIDAAGLRRHLLERDDNLEDVAVHLAAPGDATRVLCCKDVVQPRLKLGAEPRGSGMVCVLENVAVVTCGPIVGFQEGIIDMSGPGAAYTPFSDLFLVVLELSVVESLTPPEHEATAREAGLAAARVVARACEGVAPDQVETLDWDRDVDAGLPRVAYVDMLLSQGLLHDSHLLGERITGEGGWARAVSPLVLLDDGVVSGNCVSACDKNTTFHHQNNPVIRHLLSGHGTRWNLVGVVATNIPIRMSAKERSADAAVALIRELEPHGVIVTKEGFGNPDADLMLLARLLDQAGISSVLITDEFAGSDGGSQSLADVAPEAAAVISTGNANERLILPAMKTVIGPLPDVDRLAGGYAGSLQPDGSLEVELQAIMGATNELGFSSLSCREI